jgi:ADP-dependent NAD(P)H-hydrate dehydratase
VTRRSISTGRARSSKPTFVTPALLRGWPLPEPDGARGKEARGEVLAVGGSVEIPGAVMLAALAALRAGAGKLSIATVRSIAPVVAVAVPEARVMGLAQTRKGELAKSAGRFPRKELEHVETLVIGPGMREPSMAIDFLGRPSMVTARCTLVVDAAALQVFCGRRKPLDHAGGVIITPHPGEMAKLWGCGVNEALAGPLELAREAAETLHAVVVLKGSRTVVAAPDGTAFENTAGNIGLGTSGSGDVLAGVIAGLAARGADPVQAAVWGVYLHARAGEALARKIGPLGFLAREIPSEIPALLAVLHRHRV